MFHGTTFSGRPNSNDKDCAEKCTTLALETHLHVRPCYSVRFMYKNGLCIGRGERV